MKIIILILGIYIFFIKISYALPIGLLALGSDFFIIFIGFILSIFSALFFYFKNLQFYYKILIFFLLILSFFPIKYFYIEYKKEQYLNEYFQNIKQLGLYDLYYNNGFIINKYDKFVTINQFKKNYNNYYLLDIRENSEIFGLDSNYMFKHIRFPELIKNHKKILGNIKKPILVTCIDGNRGRIVSSFLGNLGYNSYYLKGGLRALGINYGYKLKSMPYCDNSKGKIIFIGIDDNNKDTIDIPYLQLTDSDVKNIINYFEKNKIINKCDNIILTCNKNKGLNCGVGIQSFGILLKNLGYKKICLGKK